jgi:predicted nucleic acid-binding protein
MIVVIDASVILKWLLGDPAREPDTGKASALVESVVMGRLEILQPVHWLAEVAAVAARLAPQTAVSDVEMLAAMEFPTTEDPNVIRRATILAIETHHHLFDTLYHAVALEHEDALLVTADERYYEKAERYGTIMALREWGAGARSRALRKPRTPRMRPSTSPCLTAPAAPG